MGSKRRLLPWIHGVLEGLDFETALDPFSGSGSVAYLMKAMGRRTASSDFLNLSATLGKALIRNNCTYLDPLAVQRLLAKPAHALSFIQDHFTGIFYNPEDLRFLDHVSCNIVQPEHPHQRTLAMGMLMRSCAKEHLNKPESSAIRLLLRLSLLGFPKALRASRGLVQMFPKRQPQGVFTISGDLAKYDDGRRDLQLSIEEHFFEQIDIFNQAVFSNDRQNKAECGDVFKIGTNGIDLIYLDPPYVPRSDDNFYIKRYHFLEELSCYWRGLDKEKIVLSYSSNGYPDLDRLTDTLKKTKRDIQVFKRNHTYHFGNHSKVKRTFLEEYLIVGR